MVQNSYRMEIGLSVIPYIGPDLYSNVPAVISELIANSWDAGATEVTIDITDDCIVFSDNGKGMSQDEINNGYLRIGYKKRLNDDTIISVNGNERHVMGRKGIGKLAPFALAECLEIRSKAEGESPVGCFIEWSGLQEAIDNDETTFRPEALAKTNSISKQGTQLKLKSIRVDKSHTLQGITNLRKQVARRFTVIHPSHSFDVKINGISITDDDRPYLSNMEFLWHIGSPDKTLAARCINLLRPPALIDNTIILNEDSYYVSGWVGTVREPSNITRDGNDTIAIFSHGKLVQEDILSELGERQIFASYVIGDIQADFLDDDINSSITNLSKPLSHASLIVAYITNDWPIV